MEQYFPDHIPWLTENDQFYRGLEAGALLMLCNMGAPIIQAKIRWDNEDQVRVASAHMGYAMEVTKRNQEWSYIDLVAKSRPIAVEGEGDEGDG